MNESNYHELSIAGKMGLAMRILADAQRGDYGFREVAPPRDVLELARIHVVAQALERVPDEVDVVKLLRDKKDELKPRLLDFYSTLYGNREDGEAALERALDW